MQRAAGTMHQSGAVRAARPMWAMLTGAAFTGAVSVTSTVALADGAGGLPEGYIAAGTLPEGSERGLLRGWPLGGISGAAARNGVGGNGNVLLLPDDRGEHGPPRLALGITGSGIDTDQDGDHNFSLGLFRWYPLLSPEGAPFGENEVDPEAVIVVDAREKMGGPTVPVLVWSSEGYLRGGSMPGVYFWDMLDPASVALPVPEAYLSDAAGDDAEGKPTRGITHNRGFEALALLPDGSFLVAPECPLVQDVAAGRGDMLRLTRYASTGTRAINAEVFRPPYEPQSFLYYQRTMFDPAGDPREQGLTEMLGLPDGRVLVLERSPNTAGGHHAKLYLADPVGASVHPLDGAAGADRPIVPMPRLELFDFASIAERFPGGVVPNLETMFFGPGIKDLEEDWIRRPLVILSDNDFEAGVPTAYAVLDLEELLAE